MSILSDILVQESGLFRIISVFLFIFFFIRLRMHILSVFKKLPQISYLIQEMLVLSTSEWSEKWQIDKPRDDTSIAEPAANATNLVSGAPIPGPGRGEGGGTSSGTAGVIV